MLVCRVILILLLFYSFFFFNDTASTEIYTYGHTLSLHDALPICTPEVSINGNLGLVHSRMGDFPNAPNTIRLPNGTIVRGPDTYNAKGNDLPNAPKLTANLSATYVIPSDRKSTRLNSSH